MPPSRAPERDPPRPADVLKAWSWLLFQTSDTLTTSLSLWREYGFVVALLVAVAIGLWRERTRLRPWHLWTPLVGLVASALGLFIGSSATRSGGFVGMGAMLPVLMMFGAAFVALVSTTVLLTLAVLLPRYGFDRRPAAVRAREYQRWRNPPDRRARSLRWLGFYMGIILIGALVLRVREFIYRQRFVANRAAQTERIATPAGIAGS